MGIINMIFNRKSTGGDNLVKKKTHICHVFSKSTNKHSPYQSITFTSKDGERVSYPSDNLIVIVADIVRFMLKRFLVDNGSSYNVLT